ncbi:MAG: hypothetical protein ACOC2K_01725 [Bacteroidota bacterium]
MKLIYLGTIVKTRGYEGTMILADTAGGVSSIPEDTEVMVGFSRNFSSPYRILSWKETGRGYAARLKGIDSKEKAEEFKEKGIFIDEEILKDLPAEIKIPGQLSGYKVYMGSEKKYIGEIDEVWEMPANDVWMIKSEEGVIPYPALQDNIIDEDPENRIFYVEDIPGIEELRQ